jgi:hypothetical protein
MTRARSLVLLGVLASLVGCGEGEQTSPHGVAGSGTSVNGSAGSTAGFGGAAGGGAAAGQSGAFAAGGAGGVGSSAGGVSGGAGAGGSAGTPSGGASFGGNASGAGASGVASGGAAGSAGCRTFTMPDDCTIPANAVLPADLRCTGLYGDWTTRELACGVQGYGPAYALWSDGATKQRYVSLPVDTKVDVTNPDGFQFPVGTSFWKEFTLPSGKLAETRLLRKVDAGWIYTSYVWSEDQTTAVQNNDGVPNLYDSGHTVPSRTECKNCHAGRPDYVLGWDAFLLGPGATGITREALVERGLVDWQGRADGAPNPLTVTAPGDEVERAALGYLHANCGVSCHNETAPALGRETGLFLNLDVTHLDSVQASPAFTTGNGRTPSPNAPISSLTAPSSGPFVDLAPLDTERSLVLVRMQVRGTEAQMPRTATNKIDEDGVAKVKAWILHMTAEHGYPAGP